MNNNLNEEFHVLYVSVDELKENVKNYPKKYFDVNHCFITLITDKANRLGRDLKRIIEISWIKNDLDIYEIKFKCENDKMWGRP